MSRTGKIFVSGGADANGNLQTIEFISVEQFLSGGTWLPLSADMTDPRIQHASVYRNGMVDPR